MRVDLEYSPLGKSVIGHVTHNDSYESVPLGEKDSAVFVDHIKNNLKFESGILPPAVRWISPDRTIVVFERPPMQQLMEFIPRKREQINEKKLSGKISYELNVPWTVYVVALDKSYLPVIIKCFFRNNYITSFDDPVYLPSLLNFYNNGLLCNPSYGVFEGVPENLGTGINWAYNFVWNTGWNYDLHDAVMMAIRKRKPFFKVTGDYGDSVRNFFEMWSKLSLDEVLNLQWVFPSAAQNGSPYDGLRLQDVIDLTKNEYITSGGNTPREMMVNIVSALV